MSKLLLGAIRTRLHVGRVLSRSRINGIDTQYIPFKQQTIAGSNSLQLLWQVASVRRISTIHSVNNRKRNALQHELFTNTLQKGDIATAWDLFMSFRGVRPAPFSANNISDLLLELTRSSLPDKIPKALVIRQALDKHKFQYKVRHFTGFIRLYISAGDPKSALIMFNKAKQSGVQIDRSSYNALLISFVENESVAEAFEIYKQSSESNALIVQIDHHFLLVRLLRAGMFAEAKYVIAEMNKFGLSADVYTYTMVIDAYAKQGQLDKAIAMFNSMAERGIEPNTHTYTVMIDAHAKHGNPIKAIAMFKSMLLHKNVPTSHTYALMIKVYVQYEQFEEAIALFKLMSPSEVEQNSYVCVAMIKAYAKWGKLEKAVALFESLRASSIGRRPQLYTTMIDAYAKNGRLDDAIVLFESMPASGVELVAETYTSMIDALAKSGQLEKAVTLFETMKAAKSRHTYSALLDAFGKRRKLKEAVALFELMEKEGIENDLVTYVIIIDVHVKQGKLIEAKKYLQRLQEKYPNEVLFESYIFICVLMDYYSRCGHHELVVSLWNKLKEISVNNDIYQLYPGVSILLDSAGRNSDLETVQSTWREIKMIKDLKPNTNNYSSYIEALCHCHAVEPAIDVLVKMMPQAKVRTDLKAIYTLLSSLLKASKFEAFERACIALQHMYPDFFSKWNWKSRSLPATETVRSWNITSIDMK